MTRAYPLDWPDGWPRTPPGQREKSSPFKVTTGQAIDDLLRELELLGARNVVISSNLTLSTFGRPYASQPRQDEPGIAVYFSLAEKAMVMARDRYADWRDNIRSVGLAINALRALHRHGGAHMMERAFSGFRALPPPDHADWRRIFSVDDDCDLAAATQAFRRLAKLRHPDVGGSESAMAELNAALAAARRELRDHE